MSTIRSIQSGYIRRKANADLRDEDPAPGVPVTRKAKALADAPVGAIVPVLRSAALAHGDTIEVSGQQVREHDAMTYRVGIKLAGRYVMIEDDHATPLDAFQRALHWLATHQPVGR